MNARAILLGLLLISSISLMTIPSVPSVHANGTVYVSPASQPSLIAGAEITYQVRARDVDPFTGWSVEVKVDPAVLLPKSVSIQGNLFQANFSASLFELTNCVNGLGTGCLPTDSEGVVHSAAAALGIFQLPGSPMSGLLFTITYTVVGDGTGTTAVDIIRVLIVNGLTSTLIPVSEADGFYGDSPDFTVRLSPSFLKANQGSSLALNVTIRSFNGFAGTVSLSSESILPVYANPSAVTLTADGVTTSSVFLSTTGCTSLATYGVSVTGTSAGLSHTFSSFLNIAGVTVNPPDFCMDVTGPSSLILQPEASNSSRILLRSVNGFDGNISLQARVIPGTSGGPLAEVTPSLSLSAGDFQTLKLNVSASHEARVGKYAVIVDATAESLSHFVVLLVNVKPVFPDFEIAVDPSSFTIPAGSSATDNVTLKSLGGFKGSLNMSVVVSPLVSQGPLASMNPSTITITGSNGSSILTVSTLTTTPQSSYIVTIAASNGSVSHSSMVIVNVRPTAPMFVQLHWRHSSSLSRQGNTLLWFAGVTNPNLETTLYVSIQIKGATAAGIEPFSDSSAPVKLLPGQTLLNIPIIGTFTGADAGFKFTFQATAHYDLDPSSLTETSTESRGVRTSGSFTILP